MYDIAKFIYCCLRDKFPLPFENFSRKIKANGSWNSVAKCFNTFTSVVSTTINQYTARYKANDNLMT